MVSRGFRFSAVGFGIEPATCRAFGSRWRGVSQHFNLLVGYHGGTKA